MARKLLGPGAVLLTPETTPAAPAAGTLLYTKTGGGLYYRDAGGVEAGPLGAGGGQAPANMLTTDTPQTVLVGGAKTFRPGALVMSNADGTQTGEPYSDANPPASLEMTLAAAPVNPVVGEATLFTTDGASLDMRSSGGVTTRIGPSAGGGGATPAWAGVLHAAVGDGEPEWEWQWTHIYGPGTVAVTPTLLTATVARCWTYRCDYAITVNRLRWFQTVGTAAASNFRFAIYNAAGTQVLAPQTFTFTATAASWSSHLLAAPLTLAANTTYYCAISATAASTTWSLRSAGTPPTTMPVPASLPANLNPDNGRSRLWYGQFAVTAGVMPATRPALAVASYAGGAGSPGSIPGVLFDAATAA